MIPNSVRAKNVFGEMTFGEYWNLVGCHAEAVRLNGGPEFITRFGPDGHFVKFFFADFEEGSKTYLSVPLGTRVRASGNRVTVLESLGRDTSIEFFELRPLDFDPCGHAGENPNGGLA